MTEAAALRAFLRAPGLIVVPGAGLTFLEAPETMEVVAAVPRPVRGPCPLNIAHRGKTPAPNLVISNRSTSTARRWR